MESDQQEQRPVMMVSGDTSHGDGNDDHHEEMHEETIEMEEVVEEEEVHEQDIEKESSQAQPQPTMATEDAGDVKEDEQSRYRSVAVSPGHMGIVDSDEEEEIKISGKDQDTELGRTGGDPALKIVLRPPQSIGGAGKRSQRLIEKVTSGKPNAIGEDFVSDFNSNADEDSDDEDGDESKDDGEDDVRDSDNDDGNDDDDDEDVGDIEDDDEIDDDHDDDDVPWSKSKGSSKSSKGKGTRVRKPRAKKPPQLDENGNPIESKKRARKPRAPSKRKRARKSKDGGSEDGEIVDSSEEEGEPIIGCRLPGWKKALLVRDEIRAKKRELEIEKYKQDREQRLLRNKKEAEEAKERELKQLQALLGDSVLKPSASAPGISRPSSSLLPSMSDVVPKSQSDGSTLQQPAQESEGTANANPNAPKRARARRPMNPTGPTKPKIDFSPPATCATPFNCSEIIKDFLYLGAGFDVNGRCITNRQNDPPQLRVERLTFVRQRNIAYVLNMAASPFQEQLVGIEYPAPEIRVKGIDMNDLDDWVPEMERMFDEGAAFIEEACNDHLSKVSILASEVEQNGANAVIVKPPSIFVHCVAGVNRSPMVVVWWLAKYHGFPIKEAWDMVRTRRDLGAQWADITLGGAVTDDGHAADGGNGVESVKPKEELDLTAPSSYQWVEVPQVGEKKKPHPKLEWYKHAKEILGSGKQPPRLGSV